MKKHQQRHTTPLATCSRCGNKSRDTEKVSDRLWVGGGRLCPTCLVPAAYERPGGEPEPASDEGDVTSPDNRVGSALMTKHMRYLIPAAFLGLMAVTVLTAVPHDENSSAVATETVATTAAVTTTTTDPGPTPHEVRVWNTQILNNAIWQNAVNQNAWYKRAAEIEAERQEAARRAAEEKAEKARLEAAKVPSSSSTRNSQPGQSAAPTSVDDHGGVCNGVDLPPCYVVQRESGFNPQARNPSSSASGLYQFIDSTWAGFGGYSQAWLAPVSVQVAKARQLWAGGAGCGHWSAC